MIKHCTLLFLLLSVSLIWGQGPGLPIIQNNSVVIAHRGSHVNAPENTLLAIQHAIDEGADYVEIDLRTTADGELVIMHDRTIDRMMNGKGEIKSFSLRQLKRIPIVAQDAPAWGWFTIPTFREVLEFCKGRINIYLDFKDASVVDTYSQMSMQSMTQQVVVYINSEEQYHKWRSIAPHVPLMVSLPDEVKTGRQLKKWLKTIQIDILDGSYLAYNKAMVKVARRNHIPIWADIQSKEESPEVWNIAIDLGLQGLQSDHPSALVSHLKKEGMR